MSSPVAQELRKAADYLDTSKDPRARAVLGTKQVSMGSALLLAETGLLDKGAAAFFDTLNAASAEIGGAVMRDRKLRNAPS